MFEDNRAGLDNFLEVMGIYEEPMGVFYTNVMPEALVSQPGLLDT